jgi:8-oxo-dGTP diphosphatase
MSKQYAVNVDAAIVRGGEYLLIVRSEDEEHAAGAYGLPGGTVEAERSDGGVLEDALRREVREEVGLTVTDLEYVESTAFVADTGERCINVVFLCRHESGEARVADEEKVEAVEWLTVEGVTRDDAIQPWTRRNVEKAEEVRTSR